MITGALGSVGRSAVHVARQHGVRVISGVRGSEKEKAVELLSDTVVALDDDQEIAALVEIDAIADTVGGPTIQRLGGDSFRSQRSYRGLPTRLKRFADRTAGAWAAKHPQMIQNAFV